MKRQRLYDRDIKFDNTDKINVYHKSNGKCAHCGREIYIGNAVGIKEENLFTIDHFIPLNRGGSNRMINLVPLCFPCNEKKGELILDPSYLKHIEEKHKTDITGMYEGYIQSFDYLSRNNLLANDVYEFDLPMILDVKKYFQMNNRRIDKVAEKKGITFSVYRASFEDVDKLTEYYIRYLQKYDKLKESAKANILWWLVNGCIYYTLDKTGNIQAFTGMWADMKKTYTGDKPVLKIMPVFYYTNEKNHMVFETLTDDIVQLIIEENKLPWLSSDIILIENDNIDQKTIYMKRKVRRDDDHKIYRGRFISKGLKDKFNDKEDVWELEPEELKALERKHKEWFEKIEVTKEKLRRFVHEDIFPPI